jgi:peroxiredoxin
MAKDKWPYPAPKDDGAAAHLIAGTRLPDIPLTATFAAPVNLARFQERAVVVFYPMTGTPGRANPEGWDAIPGAHGSTPELEGFRDAYLEFQQNDYEVYAVSSQSTAEQKAFAERSGIPVQLLSDPEFKIAEALGLPTFKAGQQRFYARLTMMVRNGVIYRAIYPVHPPHTHAADVLRIITAANASAA